MISSIVVEDEPILLNGLVKIIGDTNTGVQVAGKASDGLEAIELISTLNPDLVITDIRMPRMDGLELTRWIHLQQPNIKVIIVTGFSDFSFAQQAIKLGVADFLLKPVKKDELIQALTKVKSFIDQEDPFGVELIIEPEITGKFEAVTQAVQLLDHQKMANEIKNLWELLNRQRHFEWHCKLQLAAKILENISQQFPNISISSDLSWVDGVFEIESGNDEALVGYLLKQMDSFIEKVGGERNSISRKAVSKAKEFIEQNYASDIGLKQVADAVYLNPSYLSQIFKETTGENFINYLTRIRIEKAQQMLIKPEMKIYEIAQAVGYTDQAYFSRLFKQVVGINPIEFRRRVGI